MLSRIRIYERGRQERVIQVAEPLLTDLLARSAAGDQAAFGDLVHEHQRMVFGLAYHFVHDRDLAEELAQDVFLSLYRNIKSIESEAHLVNWLRKVTSHRCLDQVRRGKFRSHLNIDDVQEPFHVPRMGDVILEKKVRNLVASLPEKARMVVILRYQEDLDPLEIAETLDMPVNTVKSHLRRSIEALRGKLSRSLER